MDRKRHRGPATTAALLAPVALLAAAAQAGAAPRVTLTPAAAPPGAAVELRGAGFRPGRAVTVSARGTNRRARVAADRRGAFRAALEVAPTRRRGLRIVSRTAGRRVVNRLRVTRTVALAPSGEVASASGARLRWTVGAAGTRMRIAFRVRGFPRHRRLRITLDGKRLPGAARTSGRGSRARALRLPALAAGDHRVVVRAGRAALGFTITAGAEAGSLTGPGAGPATPQGRMLAALIEPVRSATAHRYGTRDDRGNSMDTLKVIRAGNGVYLGVYHALAGGAFTTMLATSGDLVTWTHAADLEANASQPTIAALPGGGFVVAFEKDAGCTGKGPGGNCLGFERYPTLARLLAGSPDAAFQAPRTLSACAEGTPNIYAATDAAIDVGFHYFRNCDVDRQARGTLSGFARWSASAQPALDAPFEAFGPRGNIGDRDGVLFSGALYNLHEVQFTKGDFGSWRTFLYEWPAHRASRLAIRTHGGSTAFANPTATLLTAPSGRPALLTTLFIPLQGAAKGEAGELVYYRELP